MTHFAPLARTLWRRFAALGVLGLAAVLGATSARGDDPTFRPFPQQAVPSPQDLAALIAKLQATAMLSPEQRVLVEQLTKEITGQSSENAPSPAWESLPPWAREAIRDLQPTNNQIPSEQPSSPSRSQIEPRLSEPASPKPVPQSTAPPAQARPPAPTREDSTPRPSAHTPPRSSPTEQSPSPVPESLGDKNEVAAPPNSAAPFQWPRPPAARPASPPAQETPFGADRPAPAPPAPSVPRPSGAAEPQRSPLRSQSEFDSQFNKILLEAAQRAVRSESADGASDVAGSRESFLTPLVRRMQEFVTEQRNEQWRHRAGPRGRSHRGSDWSLTERFDIPELSLPTTTAMDGPSSDAGYLSLLATPALAGLVALLAVPLWRRYRGRLVWWLQGAPPFNLEKLAVSDPSELVQAVDQFLIYRFGGRAAWWHCGAVRRALTELAPLWQDEIARLVSTYELARYGPRGRPIEPSQIVQAIATLRRISELHIAERNSALQTAPA